MAVKVLKTNDLTNREMEAFQEECRLFRKLPPHPNLVQFLGVCVSSSNNNSKTAGKDGRIPNIQEDERFSTRLVTEFLSEGDMVRFMRTKWQEMNEMEMDKDRKQEKHYHLILELSKGVAAGMDHLHKNNIIHRDLAARNILIQTLVSGGSSSPNKVRVVPKISDFGLSSMKRGRSTVAVRWSAPEVLRDPNSYDPKSDVWSFGIVLFELSTNCLSIPYEDLRMNSEVQKAILSGRQVTFPSTVPANFISLAKICFALIPSFRPTFSQLFEGLVQESNDVGESSKESAEKRGKIFGGEVQDGYESLENE